MNAKRSLKIAKGKNADTFKGRYVLAFILALIYVAVVVFTTQGLSLFNPGGVTSMNNLEFYLMVAASTLMGAGLLVFSVRHFKIKVNLPLLVVCAVLMVIDVVAVLIFPEAIDGEPFGHTWVYQITDSERIRFIFGWFVADVALYCFIGVFPTLFRSHKTVDFILWAGIGIAFFLILCSFIIEHEEWMGLLRGTNPDWRAKSITNYENTFGFAIVWGFCCALILYGKYRKIPALICTLFLALMTLFLRVKTCCAAVGITTILALIWLVISGWKKRKKQQIALLSVTLSIIAVVAIITIFEIPGFKSIGRTVRNMIVSLFSFSGGTMTGRTNIWHDTLGNMVRYPSILLFGTGDGVFEWFVSASSGYAEPSLCDGYPVHNGFIFVLGRFGIVGLLVYLLGIGYIFYDIIHAIKVRKEKWMGIVAVAFICYLIHSIGEDDALLDMRLKGIMGLVITWLPLAVSRREWKERVSATQIEEPKLVFKKKDASLFDVLKVSYFATSLVLVTIVGLSPILKTSANVSLFDNVYSPIGLAVLLLTLPLMIAEIIYHYRNKNYVRCYVHLALTVVITIVGMVVGFMAGSEFYLIAIILGCLLLLFEGGFGLKIKKVNFLDVLPILVRVLFAFVTIGFAHCLNKYLDPSLITRTTAVIILLVYLGFNVVGLGTTTSINGWAGSLDVLGSRTEAIYEKVAQRQLIKSKERIDLLY